MHLTRAEQPQHGDPCGVSPSLCVSICAFWFVCVSPFFYVFLGSWVISLTVFGTSVTNLNEPPRALAASTIAWVRSSSRLGRCKQKQCGLRGYVAGLPLLAPCGLRGCKNGPAPFPGRMSYKATKPRLVSVLYLSMFFYCVGVYLGPFLCIVSFHCMCCLSFGCSS